MYQIKLKQQIEQLRKVMETATPSITSVDPNLQAQLTSLIDEKQQHFNEIQTLKTELGKLLKERKQYKEEHKDNKQLKQVINKHLSEIDKLNQAIKEMQETNDFLTQQINTLNQHIFELNNGGAGNKENDETNRVVDEGFELLEPKRNQPISKRLADLSGTSILGYSSSSSSSLTANKKPTLNQVDLNNSEFAANNFNTPNRSTSTNSKLPANVNTPSSTVKRQNQCAQQ